jgi:site-specific DNA-methyltransferase (adenine-specific)
MGWNNLYLWELFSQGYFNQIGHVIWKYQFGVYTKRKPVTSHYHLLVYTKNNNHWTWNRQGYDEDVWIINRPYQKGGLKYPNKLPDEVAKQMIIRSSNEGDIVYDPFTGSGTIPKVARELGRVGIGSDLLNNKEFWNG